MNSKIKNPSLSEHKIQVSCIQWARQNEHIYPALDNLYAIPNGEERAKLAGMRLKLEGVRAGVWDLSLDWPCSGYNGLKIEMKKKGGSLNPKQKEWKARYILAGYKTNVCYSLDDFIGAVLEYLNPRK